MSINFRILGKPGRDNAVLMQVDSGQSVERLLFDCGDGCLSELSFSDIKAIDQLFFSHLHMDHVGGFDTFIRCNYCRDTKPNLVWGPPETAAILQHRLQGFQWNLHGEMSGTWRVADVHPARIETMRFELREAFAVTHDEGSRSYEGIIFDGGAFTVEAVTMDHRTPSLAYVVREKTRENIDTEKLSALGLRPGPWLNQLKDTGSGSAKVEVDGVERSVAELREELIVESPGESVAYLTDFRLDEPAMELLTEAVRGCRAIICEGQYRHADLELAGKNYHMTTVQAAQLAKRAEVGELVLFHLSERYDRQGWVEMLEEAREVFGGACYPGGWGLFGGAGFSTRVGAPVKAGRR